MNGARLADIVSDFEVFVVEERHRSEPETAAKRTTHRSTATDAGEQYERAIGAGERRPFVRAAWMRQDVVGESYCKSSQCTMYQSAGVCLLKDSLQIVSFRYQNYGIDGMVRARNTCRHCSLWQEKFNLASSSSMRLVWQRLLKVLKGRHLDALLRTRTMSDYETTALVKAQFMSLWDGFSNDTRSTVIILGATNRPHDIDEAIMRRMPIRFHVGLPVC